MKLFGSSLVFVLALFLVRSGVAGSITDDLIIINGVSHIPAEVADPEIYALISAAQVWLSHHTKLNTDVPIPQVKFASSEYMNTLNKIVTGIAPDPNMITMAMMYVGRGRGLKGEDVYVMFLRKGFTKTNILHRSQLVHEAVHNVQFRNNVPWCVTQLEGHAYYQQGKWLKEQGSMWNNIGNQFILRASRLLKKKCGAETDANTGRRVDEDGP